MDESKIARINELYHKSKEVGLSDAELKEQLILRKEYIDSVRRNLRGQLDNISVKEADGSITELGEKYGNKKSPLGRLSVSNAKNWIQLSGSHRRLKSVVRHANWMYSEKQQIFIVI